MTQEEVKQEAPDNSFKLIVKLPGKQSMDFVVVPTTTVQEIRQVVYDSPKSQFLTCFYLSHKNQKLLDMQELQSIENFEPELEVVPDLYSEHDTRVHVNRFREILTGYKSNVTEYGIDQGITYAARIGGESLLSVKEHTLEEEKKTRIPIEQVTVTGNLKDRIPSAVELKETPCVASLGLSTWNPPPLQQKIRGDYLYLAVDTLEKKHLEITCSVHGFSLNKSSLKVFNPSTEKSYPTLPGLLSAYSSSFKTQFEKIQEELNARHPFEYYLPMSPAIPWLVQPKSVTSDNGKTLDITLQSLEVIDTLCARDWNDDVQSARELPHENAQERILRDQASFRSHSDFVEAAVKGAMGIVHKTIQPLNPTEDELSQMYIHNNIFFSEGYDNKEQFDKYGGAAAAHVAASKDIDGIELLHSHDVDGIHTLGTVLVDYKGHRIVCQTIVPGILKKAGSSEPTIQYGSVDGGNEIFSRSEFVETATDLSKLLHLKTHSVVDQNGTEHSLATSVETKWVQGTDSRRYVLDLYRLTPVDAFFLESLRTKEEEGNPYPHEMVLLRPELVKAYFQHKVRLALKEYQEEQEKKQKDAKEGEEVDSEPFAFSMSLNPDAFTKISLGSDQDRIKQDEDDVREAAGFIPVIISQVILEAVQYTNVLPVETQQLTAFFHKRGINMRYLGKVTKMIDQLSEPRLAQFKHLLKDEMAARALKHLLRQELSKTPLHQTSNLIADFFNLILAVRNGADYSSKVTALTPEDLKALVHANVLSRFRYELGQEFWGTVNATLFRSLSLKVGIQLLARNYDFNTTTFQESDVLNLYPVIKHAHPRANFAMEAFEHGRVSLAQEQKELGMELIRESVSMHEQIYGPIHNETARAYANLAALYYNNEQPKLALAMQRRAVIAFERTFGFDHPETLRQYVPFSDIDNFKHL
jgi:protein TIF31